MLLSFTERPRVEARGVRRKVALAYRTAREAGVPHDRAFDVAMSV
jgi:hypothetical protein